MSYRNSHSAMMGEISEYLTEVCNNAYQKGRADAIDEYMDVLCDYCMQQNNDCCKTECPFCVSGCYIVVKAEQLKEQKNG